MLSKRDRKQLADLACLAATEAGELILRSKPKDISYKEGGESAASQIVTEVDRQSQDCILRILEPSMEQFSLGLLSEEMEDQGTRFTADYFWCIDPLDGTLPYAEGRPGYAVSIALVSRAGEAQIGVIFDPVSAKLYCAVRGNGIRLNGEAWQRPPSRSGTNLSVFADTSLQSLPDYDELLAGLDLISREGGGDKAEIFYGRGAVLNACQALSTAPAAYFKFPKPSGGGALWDFAATACLFAEAGAVATDIGGQPLECNRVESTWMNHRGILYATDSQVAERIKELHRRMRP